ncbi:hypothetical protein [Rhizobium leguminosarum]|uniref:hypothetical protein n=1 Tax=Rhizobium leguminosarum TaxID=384 RepID=UPI002E125B45|nr:hypothetical protein U8Q02_37160 [Rhizobium leguminosarum]
MSIRSTFCLLSKKRKDLTAEDKVALARVGRKGYAFLLALVAIGLAAGYVSIFSSYQAGPPRDMILDVMNMFTLSLVAGWGSFRVFKAAFKAKDWKAIPLAVIATSLLVVGACALPDTAIRLKGEVGRSLVRFKATTPLSSLLTEAKKSPDANLDERLNKVSGDLLEFARAKSQAVDTLLPD